MRQPSFKRSSLRWTIHRASERVPQQINRDAIRKYVPVPTSKPLRIRVNKRGLFEWAKWDGSLWKTPSLRIYHNTHLFYNFMRTERLRRHSQAQNSRQISLARSFWCEYHASMQTANQSLYSLVLHFAETSAISFLLRTAPRKIYKRIEDTLATIDVLNHKLSEDVGDIYRLKRILVHRQTNPLFFTESVHRFQRTTKWRQQRAEKRADSKIQRVERKGSLGHGWRTNFFQIHRVRSVYKLSQLHLLSEAAFNASPIRWTIEPFGFSINALLRELQSTLINIESLLAENRRMHNTLYVRAQTSVDAARRMGYELAELVNEMTALRYYRLHHFPNGSIEAEIETGKLLWQRTQRLKEAELEGKAVYQEPLTSEFSNAVSDSRPSPEARTMKSARRQSGYPSCTHSITERVESEHHYAAGDSEALLVRQSRKPSINLMKKRPSYLIPWNPRARQVRTTMNGFILWKGWNRTDWNIELLKPYKDKVCVRNYFYYNAVLMRQPLDERRKVDSYLLHYHRSQWEINRRLLPFVRLGTNITVTEFLLRSAPAKLTTRLGSHLSAISSLEYAMSYDILVLCALSTTLASLPLNPYYFHARARKHRIQGELQAITAPLMNDWKTQRASTKAAGGFRGLPRTYRYDKIKSLTAAGNAATAKKQRAPAWEIESFHAGVEPFFSAVGLLVARLRRFIRTLRPISSWWTRGAYWKFRELSARILDCETHTRLLTDELCALQYYRAYHFPHSVSTSELDRGKALWKEVVTWMHEGNRYKIPELLRPSGHNMSRKSAGALISSNKRQLQSPKKKKRERVSSAPSRSSISNISAQKPSSHRALQPSITKKREGDSCARSATDLPFDRQKSSSFQTTAQIIGTRKAGDALAIRLQGNNEPALKKQGRNTKSSIPVTGPPSKAPHRKKLRRYAERNVQIR